ncbi:hypothetical protein ASD11_07300 [Aeromicrobium sp. Root495]|uniref:hypothetical protein n=1 Tax=Aeromicrobium sp. Root495 TaxID=1736550 RepID=UPI0006F414C8|nr:hypothetical protein [Aeromicrobium sp. Root495]KQY59367.1 hypothetical protein ASD11_07300 [Aeromicrobium sp. Root495]
MATKKTTPTTTTTTRPKPIRVHYELTLSAGCACAEEHMRETENGPTSKLCNKCDTIRVTGTVVTGSLDEIRAWCEGTYRTVQR